MINGVPIENAANVTQVLVRIGSWSKAVYHITRRGVDFDTTVIVGEVPLDPAVTYQYLVGLAYLVIGLFVYFRRGSAQKARHFYVLCLASFVFLCFHYTGQFNAFDKVIYFGNLAAGLLAPAVFLHFCLTFPEPRKWLQSRVRVALLYLPAALLFAVFVAFATGALTVAIPLLELRWMLDRVWMVFWTVPYVAGGFALSVEYRKAEDPIVRQQLKWLRNGAFCGILPFALLYVLPYAMGAIPNAYLKMSVLSLPLIPLTLAYAIVRYRLMDVDIIFRRGYAYTLATICVLAAFYGIVFSLGSLVQKNFKDLGNIGLITVMLIAAFLFQPIRNWIQERLDKHFYRDRYDYRRTLVEFARELSSETDLDAMLASVGERLLQTLSIKHMAFFLAEEGDRRSRIPAEAVHGRQPPPGRRRPRGPGSQLSQLEAPGAVSVLRAHAPPARRRLARLAGFGAARHRRSGSHLLPALHGARPDHRLPGRQPHRRRRLSFQRGRGAAGHAGRLRGHRHRERLALPLAAAQGGRVRAAQGIQREHRRIHQRRHSGGRPGRPRGKLEHADRAAQRHSARPRRGPDALRAVPRRSWPRSSTACAARPASTTSTNSC